MDTYTVYHQSLQNSLQPIFLRGNDQSSFAKTKTLREVWEKKSSNYNQMELIEQAYASKRECSVKEAVYH